MMKSMRRRVHERLDRTGRLQLQEEGAGIGQLVARAFEADMAIGLAAASGGEHPHIVVPAPDGGRLGMSGQGREDRERQQ